MRFCKPNMNINNFQYDNHGAPLENIKNRSNLSKNTSNINKGKLSVWFSISNMLSTCFIIVLTYFLF